jgi:hypothetical protein
LIHKWFKPHQPPFSNNFQALFNYTQVGEKKMDNIKNTQPGMTVETYTSKAVEIVTKALSDAGINNEIIRTCVIGQESQNTWASDFIVKLPLGELFVDPESVG